MPNQALMSKKPLLFKSFFTVGLGLLIAIVTLVAFCLNPSTDLISKPLFVKDVKQPADVIIALSAGLIKDCKPHPNLVKRESYASQLRKEGLSQSGKVIITGQYSIPSVVTDDECHSMLSKQLDIPEDALIIDNVAFSTQDNVLNSKAIMKKHGWKTALIVTEKSHMMRTMLTFKKAGITVYPVSVPDYPIKGKTWHDMYRMEYVRRFLYEYGALMYYKWYGYI